MIPFICIEPFDLGIVKLQPFGILVAIGVLFGTYMGKRYAVRHEMDEEDVRWMGIRLVIWGFIACHLFDVFFYTPEKIPDDPLLILKIWEGIASWGGIVGGGLALFVYCKLRGWDPLRWADLFAYAFVPGLMFGRMGCSVAHDHIGVATDSVFAVDVPKNCAAADLHIGCGESDIGFGAVGSHYDLGFYELCLLVVIWGIVLLVARWKERPNGLILAVAALLYAPPRFMLDFLRRADSDPRYLGFTPAQYAAILSTLLGLYLAVRILQGATGRVADNPPQQSDEPDAKQRDEKKPAAKKAAPKKSAKPRSKKKGKR